MPSKARSDSNQPGRKQEHRYSDEDLKIHQQHDARVQQQQRYHHQSAYEQPVRSPPPRRPAGPRSAGPSSRRPSDSPSVPSSFSDQSSSHSQLSNSTKSASGVALPAIQPVPYPRDRLQEPSRKTSKSCSLRSEPPSVASPSLPPRPSTMPTPSRDVDPIPISPSSRFTSKSEPVPHGSSPHRPDPAHAPTQASSTNHHRPHHQHHMPSLHAHASRSNSAPQSPSYIAHRPHTSSGYVSDSGTSVASVVDMKRLLSKPALPSSPSLPSHSDSEALSSSGSQVHGRTEKKPGLEASASSSRHTLDDSTSSGRLIKKEDKPLPLVDTSASTSTALHHSTSSLEDPPSTYTRPNSVSSSPRETKPYTALKRRPSGPRSPPLPSFSTSEVDCNDSAQPHLTIDSPLTKRAGFPEMEVSRSTKSSPLTPAGAVAEAYKQQVQKRRSIGSGSGSGGDKVPSAPFSDALGAEASVDAVEASPMPYYTVFGSISGRLVAVGGPEDILLDEYHIHGRHQSPKPETGTGRSLTRKVSAKWKKATGGGIKGERSPPDTSPSSSCTDVNGRASAQERRSLSLPGRDRSKHGWSYDIRPPDVVSTSGSTSTMQNALTAKAWGPSTAEEDVRVKPGKLVKARIGDRERDNPKEKENDEEGGRIWKLMKRISTGGLRDRFNQAADKELPPVPALPKDLAHQNVRQSVDGDSSGVLSRYANSRASMPATGSGSHRSGSPRASSSHPLKAGPSSTVPRPSTTTGSSSSPVSSDFASSPFFRPTHSAGSSSSSYGDEVPHPVPSPMIAQHIIPPSELYRMNMDHENEINYPKSSPNSKPRTHRSASVPICDSLPPPDNSPEEIRGTLPFPPRRLAANGNTSQQRQPSKADTINSFRRQTSPIPRASGQHNNNNNLPSLTPFLPQSDSDNVVGTPSRLSSKHPRRPRLGSISQSQSSLSPPTMPLSGEKQVNSRLAEDPHRKSSGGFSNASTVRQRSSPFNTSVTSHVPTQSQSRRPIIGDSAIHINGRSPSSSGRSPLTFRELGSSPSARAPLTAQEKADIWDDLLERSDRAGGTIHLGGQELMSDQMRLAGGSRLSNYTETTDIP